jgi:hypothetical protein
MKECRLTLLTDGRSDRALMPPITWLLHEKLPGIPIQLEWADLTRLPRPPKGLDGRIKAALGFYPCDILLVHRDAEGESRNKRVVEIQDAVAKTAVSKPHICVVTVRMQEAWMLINEASIRSAAGNPNGTVTLRLPKLQEIESLPDPKSLLRELLRKASELTGRRLKKFSASANAHRVAELVDDWQPLRKLSAFVEFEGELDQILATHTHHVC